jgi:hypothetical protein
MRVKLRYYSWLIAAVLMLAGTAARAKQSAQGEASAVQVTLPKSTSLGSAAGLPTTTTLADTGPLSDENSALDASMLTASVPSILNAETLSSSTISWPDEVDSVTSLGNLNLTVAGIPIRADLVMAEASQGLGTASSGDSIIEDLSINGVSTLVTGYPNQTVAIPGGRIIINEQTISSTGTAVVNALHVIIPGVANVIIASASAGI